MKSILGKSAVKKTMRVATAFTGAAGFAAAGLAAYAPAAKADSAVPYPYDMWVDANRLVYSVQACGWKDTNEGTWTCTLKHHNTNFYSGTCEPSTCTEEAPAYQGSNWKDGQVDIYTWGGPHGSKETQHVCNTNGAYVGHFRGTGTSFGVSLSANNDFYGILPGTSEC